MTFDGVSPMAELRKKNGSEKPFNLKYFGVGNESWGCGGNMDPEYYGCLFKRYNTYCRDYDSNKHISRISCGPNVDDYHCFTITLSLPVNGTIKALQRCLIKKNMIQQFARLTEWKNLLPITLQ